MDAAHSGRLFTFRSGGWVLALAIAVSIAGTLWNLAPLWRPGRERPRGDGRRAASYGFELGNALVPEARIAASGMVADALPALEAPRVLPISRLADLPPVGRGKYVVGSDKVIGVVLNGEARAYPLRVLAWHEIANDVVGGIPIAVTYNPLSAGIGVFDRRAGGEVLSFGVSGLLYESNLLMYDRRSAHRGESLWSQLQARAITGPAAARGATLTLVPMALCRFEDWARAHPESTIVAPLAGEEARYGSDVYGSYLNSNDVRFPVDPMPPPQGLPFKTVVFASPRPGGGWSLTPLQVDADGGRLEVVGPSGTVPAVGLYAFWFAWYATREGAADSTRSAS
jgi:hypothetical protein